MKVGILTFHRSYNYGAFIQCYALVQRLKGDFPHLEIEVMDYSTAASRRNYERKLHRAPAGFRKKLLEMHRIFDKAQEMYLPLSRQRIISDEAGTFFDGFGGRYDMVVVGSDAVWNWVDKPFPNAYFLGGDLGAIKMSYAASAHGQYYREMTAEQRSYLSRTIGSFGYIGVREPSAREMLRYCGIRNPVYPNCDPSLLLELDSLPLDMMDLKIKLGSSGVDFSRPRIGVMAGGFFARNIKKYFGNRVQIVAIYEPDPWADVYLPDLNPLEWARVFSFFDVTVTRFYHGTLMSLKNLTPVIAVETKTAYHGQYVSKIKHALTEMELEMFYAVFDRGPLNLFNRALYRFGLKRGWAFWYSICNRIEELIDYPRKERIACALKKEERLYRSFKDYLEKTLNPGRAP